MIDRNEEDWTTFTIFNDDLKLIGFHVFLSKDQNFLLKTWKYSSYPIRRSQKLLIKKKKELTFEYVDMIRLKIINGTKNGIFTTFPYQKR